MELDQEIYISVQSQPLCLANKETELGEGGCINLMLLISFIRNP